MSLAADVSVARPLPPSRAKRYSEFSPTAPHEGSLHVNGVLGGLREKSEDELKAADRDALEHALRQAWEDHEQVSRPWVQSAATDSSCWNGCMSSTEVGKVSRKKGWGSRRVL